MLTKNHHQFSPHAAPPRGFTLIELLITVAIIAILAAIALPSYYQYILRSNRSAAESIMLEMASAQERHMLDARQFASSASVLGYQTLPDTVAPNYTVAVATSAGPPPSYTITATPINGQTSDTRCMTLTLGGDGSKSASGSSPTKCWK